MSLSMRLSIAEHRRRVVLPGFNGLITDNAAAREAIARRFGVAAGNAFAILERTGERAAGFGRGRRRAEIDAEIDGGGSWRTRCASLGGCQRVRSSASTVMVASSRSPRAFGWTGTIC
ncbi:HipA N-terminal domain-containing protein [Gordonia sp. NPDC003504]